MLQTGTAAGGAQESPPIGGRKAALRPTGIPRQQSAPRAVLPCTYGY